MQDHQTASDPHPYLGANQARSNSASAAAAGGQSTIAHLSEIRSSLLALKGVRKLVSRSPLRPIWSLGKIPTRVLALRTWKQLLADRVFGHAAELGFYFLFSPFPTLFCAGSALGLAARSAHQISDRLLSTLALVIPTSAVGTVLRTFNQTAAAASSGKVTFGSIAAIWSASVGISAIQDTLNAVYKLNDTRSYVVARVYAIGLTILLTVLVGLTLGCVIWSDVGAALADRALADPVLANIAGIGIRILCWAVASCILTLSFAVLYNWAPDWKTHHWRWLTPGTAVGVFGWVVASLGLRVYLHFFNNYSITYGSLGAVIILLTWFYLCGLMLLLGAEIDTVIDICVAEGAMAADATVPALPP